MTVVANFRDILSALDFHRWIVNVHKGLMPVMSTTRVTVRAERDLASEIRDKAIYMGGEIE